MHSCVIAVLLIHDQASFIFECRKVCIQYDCTTELGGGYVLGYIVIGVCRAVCTSRRLAIHNCKLEHVQHSGVHLP